MKGSSGKFSPLKQWFFFDALEALPETPLAVEGTTSLTSFLLSMHAQRWHHKGIDTTGKLQSLVGRFAMTSTMHASSLYVHLLALFSSMTSKKGWQWGTWL